MQKKNPLKNAAAMIKLNPYAKEVRKSEAAAAAARAAAKASKKKVKHVKRDNCKDSNARKAASKSKFDAFTNDEFVRPAGGK